MLRKILGVIVGYVAMVILTFILLTVLYNVLGADGVFGPGHYQATTAWLGGAVVVTLLVSILGGYIAKAVGKSAGAVQMLAGLVFVLGMIVAVIIIFGPAKPMDARPAAITMFEAIAKIHEPVWVCIVNPIVGTIGVLIGGILRKLK
jgi:hypothetical protein